VVNIKYLIIFLFILLNSLFYFNIALESLSISFFKQIIQGLIMMCIIIILGIMNKKYLLIFLSLFPILYLSNNIQLAKIITFPFLFYIGYMVMFKYCNCIRNILILIVALNAAFIFIELNGLIEGLDIFQAYGDPAVGYKSSLFVEERIFALYQIRPSGIYQSTAVLSLQMIFMLSILLYDIKNKVLISIITFIAIFSGSSALFTVSIIFPIISYFSNVNNMKTTVLIFLFLILWLVFYFIGYPGISGYNFNFASYLHSFSSRLDSLDSTTSFSLNINSVFFITIILSVSLFYLIKNKFIINIINIYFIVAMISMLIIHNFLGTSMFYINLGMLLGFLHFYMAPQQSKISYFERVKLNPATWSKRT